MDILTLVLKYVIFIIMVEGAVELIKPLLLPIQIFYPAFHVTYLSSIVIGIIGASVFQLNILSMFGAHGSLGCFLSGFIFARISNYLHMTFGKRKTDLMDLIETQCFDEEGMDE